MVNRPMPPANWAIVPCEVTAPPIVPVPPSAAPAATVTSVAAGPSASDPLTTRAPTLTTVVPV